MQINFFCNFLFFLKGVTFGGEDLNKIKYRNCFLFSHSDITASTLYFSDSVKRIRNKATVNENIAGENVEVLKKEISRLREENERMKG